MNARASASNSSLLAKLLPDCSSVRVVALLGELRPLDPRTSEPWPPVPLVASAGCAVYFSTIAAAAVQENGKQAPSLDGLNVLAS